MHNVFIVNPDCIQLYTKTNSRQQIADFAHFRSKVTSGIFLERLSIAHPRQVAGRRPGQRQRKKGLRGKGYSRPTEPPPTHNTGGSRRGSAATSAPVGALTSKDPDANRCRLKKIRPPARN